MAEKFANATEFPVPITLTAGINASVTTVPISVLLPTSLATGQCRVRVDDELMLVTAGQGTLSLTVTRGVEGTTAVSHASGALVKHRLTAAVLTDHETRLGAMVQIAGDLGGTAAVPTVPKLLPYAPAYLGTLTASYTLDLQGRATAFLRATLGVPTTTITPINVLAGGIVYLMVTQDATGNRGIAFPYGTYQSAGTLALSTGPGMTDLVRLTGVDGVTVVAQVVALNINPTTPAPDTIPNLAGWFVADDTAGADGDVLAAVTTRLGGALTQATLANRPLLKKGVNGINGRNVINFDGVNDRLDWALVYDSATAYTAIAVVRIRSPFTDKCILGNKNGNLVDLIKTDNGWRLKFSTLPGYQLGVSAYQFSADTLHCIVSQWSPITGAFRLFVDGVPIFLGVTTDTIRDNVAASADAPFQVGATWDNDVFSFKGDMAEMMIYNRWLTALELGYLIDYVR